MANREDALKEVIQKKPELVKSMIECPEPEKLKSLLNDNGIDVTETEASKIMRAINFYTVTDDVDGEKSDGIKGNPTKLDDDTLDCTGGGLLEWFRLARLAYGAYRGYQNAKQSKDNLSDIINDWKNSL